MLRTFAYLRVSTVGQTTDNQLQEIKAAGFKVEPRRVVTETESGNVATSQRHGFTRLLDRSFTPVEGIPYHLIRTGTDGEPGIDGGLVRRMGPNPDPQEPTPVVGYVCTVN